MSASEEALQAYTQHAQRCPTCDVLEPRCTEGLALFEAWRTMPGVNVPTLQPVPTRAELERAAQSEERRSLSELVAIAKHVGRIADALERSPINLRDGSPVNLHKLDGSPVNLRTGSPVNLLNADNAEMRSDSVRTYKAMLLTRMRLSGLSFAASHAVSLTLVQLGEGPRAVRYPVVLAANTTPCFWRFPAIERQVSENVLVMISNPPGQPVVMRELCFWGDEL
jgi:hypothetical protein